jgi:hypothetical protein
MITKNQEKFINMPQILLGIQGLDGGTTYFYHY